MSTIRKFIEIEDNAGFASQWQESNRGFGCFNWLVLLFIFGFVGLMGFIALSDSVAAQFAVMVGL